MKNVSVIGSGTMGNGIAHVFAQYGYAVSLVDVNEPALKQALDSISKNLDRQLRKELLTQEGKIQILDRITTSTDLLGGVQQADLVIEAVTEVLI